MNKKVLFTAFLSTVLLVGCNGYSKVSAEKAKEVQTENLKKEVAYTKAVATTVVDKLDVDVKGDLPADAKDMVVSAVKVGLLASFGVEEVGKKVENEVTNAEGINAYRYPAEMFAETEGTTYYTSGSKIKVVSEVEEQGLKTKGTMLINEYGYMTSTTASVNGEMKESGMSFSVKLSYKMTVKYSK